MSYLKSKLRALLSAPQTERGYLRTVEGTGTISLTNAHAIPPACMEIDGQSEQAEGSYSLATFVPGESCVHEYVCEYSCQIDSLPDVSSYSGVAIVTASGTLILPTEDVLAADSGTVLRVTEGDDHCTLWQGTDASAPYRSIAGTSLPPGMEPIDAYYDIALYLTSRQIPLFCDHLPEESEIIWQVSQEKTIVFSSAVSSGDVFSVDTSSDCLYRGANLIADYSDAEGVPSDVERFTYTCPISARAIAAPHVCYRYSGMSSVATGTTYAVETGNGYLLVPSSLVTGTNKTYEYDSATNWLTWWYNSDPSTVYRATFSLFSMIDSRPTYAQRAQATTITKTPANHQIRLHNYAFTNPWFPITTRLYISLGWGYAIFDGRAFASGQNFVFKEKNNTLYADNVPVDTSYVTIAYSVGSDDKNVSSYSTVTVTYDGETNGLPAGLQCRVTAPDGTNYGFKVRYPLRIGDVLTFDFQAMTVTDAEGRSLTLSSYSPKSNSFETFHVFKTVPVPHTARKTVFPLSGTVSETGYMPNPHHPSVIRNTSGIRIGFGGTSENAVLVPESVVTPERTVSLALSSVGETKDSLTVKGKAGRVVKITRVAHTALSDLGTPTVFMGTNTLTLTYPTPGKKTSGVGRCSHISSSVASGVPDTIHFPANGNPRAEICLSKSDFPTAAAWEDYLLSEGAAGRPVIIEYPLAAPETTDVTDTQSGRELLALCPSSGNGVFSVTSSGTNPAGITLTYYSREESA